MAKTREERRQFWRGHIGAWRQSGQRREDYCREHGLNRQSFNVWVGRLRDEFRRGGARSDRAAGGETATFVPVEVRSGGEPAAGTEPDTSDARIEIDAGGVTLRVSAEADTDVLARIITAARRAA